MVLAAGSVVAALLWGLAVALMVAAAAGAADWLFELSHEVRVIAVRVGFLAGGGAIVAALWRRRRVRSLEAVALWAEEQVPSLRYALVTAIEPRWADAAPQLEREISVVNWRAPLMRATVLQVTPPAVLLLAALGLGAVLPAGVVSRISAPHVGDALAHPGSGRAASRDRLSLLVANITPPAYTGLSAVTVESPASISALAGSGVRIEGRGAPDGVEAKVGELGLDVTGDANRWRVVFAMPTRATVVRLRDGSVERLIALEPRPDSAPVITLVSPARDTVLRAPAGALPLGARATDDFGLDALWFEYIVSSGEGESFTFRSGVVRRTVARGARAYTLDASLALDSLKLVPGDIVHLRAVAVDGNRSTGPDTGVSETRTVRIPRPSEYDSVAVEGAAPPDVDESDLSQRMLIQLTEALQQRRGKLSRSTLVAESQRIAADQARLRRRVGDIIFARLGEESSAEDDAHEHGGSRAGMTPEQLLKAADAATAAAGAHEHALDFGGAETPVVAVNRPLLEAYNAMWDAGRELGIGEPGRALPHMRAALEAIQRARQAERIYLRGRPAAVVVDLAKVRLAGKISDALPAGRAARPAVSGAGERAARLDAALAMLASAPATAVDSLLLLRVDALEHAPALAAALGTAVDALRAGRDATELLVRARRIAVGPPLARTAPAWGGAW
jgi:hypothetical protein